MSIWKSLALAVVMTSNGPLGCDASRPAKPPVGGIELVVRSPMDARLLGTFTVRRPQDSKTWRLPLRAEGYQKQRLLLDPGLYALDFEADVSAAVAEPGLEHSVQTSSSDLPRWVIVASAQVTTVDVATQGETSSPCIAIRGGTAPNAPLPLN